MLESKKIKIEISTGRFGKWYDPGFTDMKTFTISLDLIELPSIKLASEKRVPYLHHYLILDERNKGKLYTDIAKSILNKYENVTAVDMNSFSQKIYTPDFSSEIDSWIKIFKIPSEENTQKTHKNKTYEKYFEQNLFVVIKDKKKPFLSEYIGFTDKSQEELKEGEEIKCIINFTSGQETKVEYIFIKGIDSIRKKSSIDSYSYYFIMPNDILNQLKAEIEKLNRKYTSIREIKSSCTFFDEGIRQFEKGNIATIIFENKISHYFIFEYSIENGIQLIKTPKEKNKLHIESKATTGSLGSYKDYDRMEMQYGFRSLDDDDYHKDDWVNGLYS